MANPGFLREFSGMTRWVGRLILLNVLVFLLQMGSPFVTYWIEYRPIFILSAPWTIITYMFAHANFMHIFFNMFGLWIFGPRVEMRLGTGRFLGLYFFSGIIAALAQSVVAPTVALIGASGAIYGVTVAFAHYWPREPIYLWGVLKMEAWTLVILFAVLSLFEGITGTGGNVAHFAHLGGFAGGWLFVRWVDRFSPARRFRQMAASPRPSQQLVDVNRWKNVDLSQLHPVNREEYERVLTKLEMGGVAGLSASDVEFLERFSRMAN